MVRDIAAGIDTSTQSCTIALRNLTDGSVIAEARTLHPKTTPPVSEQYPEDWWNALILAFNELKEYLSRIACIAVGGQGHGLVILDESGKSLRKAKLWNDTESYEDAEVLRKLIGDSYFENHIGSIPAPALTVSKLMWTERNYNGLLKKAKYIMLPADYIVYKLTGEFVTERGVSSGTGYFNPHTNTWDMDILNKAVSYLDESILPKILVSSALSGEVRDIPELPELKGAFVGLGTGDNMTAAIGLNCKEGDSVMSLGTSGTIYSVTKKSIKDTYGGCINLYADATGRYLPMVTTLNAAKVTDTFRRLLSVSIEEFDELVLNDKDNGAGVVLVPYLDGERTPNLPFATGHLSGIRTNTTKAHIASAVLNGVICNLLEGCDILKKIGVDLEGRFILTGGGSKSISYRQILADLTGKEVYICKFVETSALGAALYGASAFKRINIETLMEEWALPLEVVARPRNINVKKIRAEYSYAANIVKKS